MMITEEKIYRAAQDAFQNNQSKFHWPKAGLDRQSDEFKFEFSLMCADINSIHLQKVNEALERMLEKKEKELNQKQTVSEILIGEYRARVYRWKLVTVIGWFIALVMLLVLSLAGT